MCFITGFESPPNRCLLGRKVLLWFGRPHGLLKRFSLFPSHAVWVGKSQLHLAENATYGPIYCHFNEALFFKKKGFFA